jgi:hypothetical protein
MLDLYIKIAHILFFALWLGPTLGAYWILKTLGKKLSLVDQINLEKAFSKVVMFQHFAFIILLATGLTIAHRNKYNIVSGLLLMILITGVLIFAVIKP